jgi:hypothetical protein
MSSRTVERPFCDAPDAPGLLEEDGAGAGSVAGDEGAGWYDTVRVGDPLVLIVPQLTVYDTPTSPGFVARTGIEVSVVVADDLPAPSVPFVIVYEYPPMAYPVGHPVYGDHEALNEPSGATADAVGVDVGAGADGTAW